jgi:hypothetical protein
MDYHYGFEINFRSVIFLRFADTHQEVSAPAAPEGQTPPVRGGALCCTRGKKRNILDPPSSNTILHPHINSRNLVRNFGAPIVVENLVSIDFS